jgi:8-oxo-dGTP pyrophosphatase MutT (NUDIX family)
MSKEEKNRCLEYYYKQDAHSIWKDLWININSKIYKKDYKRCTDVFFKNMDKYMEYFKDDKIGKKENEWGFPKGRKHSNENEIECALREFEEETNISSKDIFIDKNINFEEVYIGSNNLLYKTIYYLAYIPYIPKKIYKYYPNNIRKKCISAEINDCEWMEYQTAIEHLNEPKKQILEKINYILKRSFKK